VRLTRSPVQWDPARRDGPDELVFKAIPDDTQRLLALQAGEIEGLAHLNPRDYATAMADGAGTRVDFDPALNVLYLGFNQAHAPWANLDCRLAVAQALDRARYVRDFFPGDAQVADAMQPPSVWGHSSAGEHAYDPAQARLHWEACLASGAVPPADVRFYVPPVARPYLPDPAGLGAAIQTDLAAVGISVTIASPEWQSAWLPDVHSGRADLFLLGWTGVNGDPDGFLCPLFCGTELAFNASDLGQPLPPDDELAVLLQEAQTVTDTDRRTGLYAQAHALIFESVPAIPLAYRQSAWAYRAGVVGNIPSPIESVFFHLSLAP
jgi:ABC-type transport system substrate-binding protein